MCEVWPACVCERDIERQAAEVTKKSTESVIGIKHQSSDILVILILLLYNSNINYIGYMIKSYKIVFFLLYLSL